MSGDRLLRIGLISPYDFASPGGVQSHIRELASQFRDWGHRVRVIGPCSDRSEVTDKGFIPMGKPISLPSRGSIERVSIAVWLRPRMAKLLQSERFDVVHLHEPFASYVCLGILSQSQTTNVATFHAYPGSRLYNMGGSMIAKRYLPKLHGRIAVSQPALDYISDILPGSYDLIPNGLAIKQFQSNIDPLEQYQDGMINLLFLGRSDKRKGLKYLLLAYSQLKWDWPTLRLIVVGPGNPDGECQRIIAERGIEDVVFVGEESDEDKVRYYVTADIYCSPATGGESFGIVLVEGMAAGKPIVASDIPGYASVLRDSVEGILVPPKDHNKLAESIAKLLQDPQMRDKLARNGLQRAQDFRWENVAERVMAHYQVAIEKAIGTP